MKHFGLMLDCSRNGVLKVESVKRYIDILKKLGFNTLMLYTEDTFEVDNQPFFGYLRGRYSKDELKEIDAYACENGIELMPCIQTLAHVNAIVRWRAYQEYTDVNDILLAGDERTYKLIDDIFATLAQCFTSRNVNIGMDEAHMVGLGKYLDQHGYEDRTQILTKHLERVCGIAEKYGFKPIMWSDMFFRLASGGDYYKENVVFDEEVVKTVPENLGLVYWDYYGTDKSRYDKMFAAHKQFNNEIWYAGGIWTWNGFAPRNAYAIKTIEAAIPSALENGIENVFFTAWGDDGAECSPFASLPALYYAAMRVKGIEDMEEIKKGFYQEFGITFDDYMLLDLPDTTGDKNGTDHGPEKYMTYNDCFSGIFDCVLEEDESPNYGTCARKLEKLAENEDYGYIFASLSALCDFLQVKYNLGQRTRKAYKTGDKETLREIRLDYHRAGELLEKFYECHRRRWFVDNKPQGFDIQDIRIGGLLMRLKSCGSRLEDYLQGKIQIIEELEEEILPEFPKGHMYYNNWETNVTVNVMTHL